MENGAARLALPASAPLPVFCTLNVRSLLDPTVTSKVLHRLRHPSEEDERLAKLTPQ